MTAPRIAPLSPPYPDDIQDAFDKIMPPGVPPLNIFRTFARHPLMLKRTMHLGAALLSQGVLPARDREIALLRTCARCGSAYEWGVHVTAFARPLGFTDAQVRAMVLGTADDPAWTVKERMLIRVADELHDAATISDGLWGELKEYYNDEALIELICVCGFYHAISYMTNACRIAGEVSAEPFPQG